ncbi:hypothetical protein CP975_09745 [Streptomyces alboniger]|uniref:Uncharacterized protein n=1 Tax=Streptomyces alboniger TaxID=132473 RepID=A0A5J6HGZ9_STRAD|nr:hypothetical protein CP975_09745 [Streptomyces alboniger]
MTATDVGARRYRWAPTSSSDSMGGMGSHQNTSTGRDDLEPFWPSRQHHDFDRVCCRAMNARAL